MGGISQHCTHINGGDIFIESPSRMMHKGVVGDVLVDSEAPVVTSVGI